MRPVRRRWFAAIVLGLVAAGAAIVSTLVGRGDGPRSPAVPSPGGPSAGADGAGRSALAPVGRPAAERDGSDAAARDNDAVAAHEPAEAQGAEPEDALRAATDGLAREATDSLDGVLRLNDVLDHLLELAALPVSLHPDFERTDSDAIAYPLEGGPEGMRAWMLVGSQPYEIGERTFRFVEMEVSIPLVDPEYLDGTLREGPDVSLSISYDVDDPATPARLALLLKRRVDLSGSRRAGIDAYTGRFTTGAWYARDLFRPSETLATTFGLIDGNPASLEGFGGAPLVGDTHLDVERLEALLARLREKLATIAGEER